MSDAISLAYQRLANLPGSSLLWRFLSRAELSRLSRYEKNCPENFDLVWLHSEVDRRFLELRRKSVRVFPLGVDLDEFPFKPARGGNVVAFVGNMSFSLNLDACRHFIRDILPALRTRAGLRFRVIGACTLPVKRELEKHASVEVTGAVGHIADAVNDVFCGVCPVRAGAGIQSKILNYLALGIPCVTSDVGLEGLNAVDGHDLLVYRKPEEAVDLILKLHESSSVRNTMAENGRRYVEKAHDWKSIHTSIREDVAELFAAK
jgi:glycosyltransferase involved in cell wall biosynthesis